MKSIILLALALSFSANLMGAEFVCTAPDGRAFPEKEIKITLNSSGKDIFEATDDDPMTLEHMKEDRLRWKFGFFNIEMVLDARKQRLEIYDEDGILEETYPLNCSKAEEAEQEMIAGLLQHGKMLAQSPDYKEMISDVPRDAREFELPMVQERSFNEGTAISK